MPQSIKIMKTLSKLDLEPYRIYKLASAPNGVGIGLKLSYTTQNFISIIYDEVNNNYEVKLMRITAHGFFKKLQRFRIDNVNDIAEFFYRPQFSYTNYGLIKVGDTFQINGSREFWEVVLDTESNTLKYHESTKHVQGNNILKGTHVGMYLFNHNSKYAKNTLNRRKIAE
jgi:hypothetical protein